MIPSPVEARALAHVDDLPHLWVTMRGQHRRGRAEHGQPIDAWQADRVRALAEGAAEVADAFTYLERAGDVPPDVYAHLRAVAEWLEQELWAHP